MGFQLVKTSMTLTPRVTEYELSNELARGAMARSCPSGCYM